MTKLESVLKIIKFSLVRQIIVSVFLPEITHQLFIRVIPPLIWPLMVVGFLILLNGLKHKSLFSLMSLCQKSFPLVLKCAVWQNDTSPHSCYLRSASPDPGTAVQYADHPLCCNHCPHHRKSGSTLLQVTPRYFRQYSWQLSLIHSLPVLPSVIEVTVMSLHCFGQLCA